ncbi:peptide ABC transporter ATP-binding protein [Dolosicoccus paucivorans]|uniref:Peptide ABC transporter ATP-binding protein n=1 Tax=Dolosicoccus paucivorans TaxID=84521 RepID=A0A2N6SNN8_9LACT|nr:ABC transporter ATP-binding protein [Dolosicoccus paucivorans]PMB83630.1 peptide ABC transporter ATP-binding protein [Dolosicoccus paucivorans]PMC58656.1 peptide ABC transporter ATP-binding protein [Dolosicoccus paucivorans]
MSASKTLTPLIDIKNINKYYQMGEQELHVLKDVNLTIYSGEFVSIMGPSGSGKSTLINVLGFLDYRYDGDYIYQGKPIEEANDSKISWLRNHQVGFVFQDFNLIDSMTVYENVQLPLLYAGLTSRQSKDKVMNALESVGLKDKAKHRPSELSGGQKQRVAIARALINEPSFIIADEPTGALDTKTARLIMDILKERNEKDRVTIVMVTHDPTLQRYADRHITIVDGVVSQVNSAQADQKTQEFNRLTAQSSLKESGEDE